MRLDELVPEKVVGQIAPRPLLIINGERDERVPRWMSERLFQAASEPRRLQVVKGAGHGDYHDSDPTGYRATLLEFFGQVAQMPLVARESPPSE
jgi:fermentation-respiration switch protein FrsA (DUF1100 family)